MRNETHVGAQIEVKLTKPVVPAWETLRGTILAHTTRASDSVPVALVRFDLPVDEEIVPEMWLEMDEIATGIVDTSGSAMIVGE